MPRVTVPLGLLMLLAIGCAPTRGELRGRRLRVAILPVSAASGQVITTPTGGTIRLIAGQRGAREQVRHALALRLEELGFRVQAPGATDDRLHGMAKGARAGQIARDLGVDLVMTGQITAWDPALVRSQGRMHLALFTQLFDAKGARRWQGRSERQVTEIRAYRARQDWRRHVQAAVDQLLATIP